VLYGTADAVRFNAQELLDAVYYTARQTFSGDIEIVCEAGDVQLRQPLAVPAGPSDRGSLCRAPRVLRERPTSPSSPQTGFR
jgi:hypothetical protein